MIQGIVFDMDGLLFDTERLAIEGSLIGARQMGLPLSEEVVVSTLGCTAADTGEIYRRALGREFDHAALHRFYHDYIEEQIELHGMPLMPGVVELLEELVRRGLPAAVATSSRSAVAERHFARCGLRHHFAALIGGDMVEHGKPAPDIYLAACAALELPPERCMALEDSRNGILAARAAGLYTVMIPDLLQPDEELRPHCHAILPSLHEVVALLERQPSAEVIFN